MSLTELAITEVPFAAAYLFAMGALAFGVVPVTPGRARLARNCFLAGCVLFAGISIMWGVTTDIHVLPRLFIVFLFCGVAGVGAVEATRFITKEQLVRKEEQKPEAQAPPRPTFDVNNHSVVDAQGAVINGTLPPGFAKVDNNSMLTMPGAVLNVDKDGTIRQGIGTPTAILFPAPRPEDISITKAELIKRARAVASGLNAMDKNMRSEYFGPDGRAILDGEKKHEISRRYLAQYEDKFAQPALDVASAMLARVPPFQNSEMTWLAQQGVMGVLHKSFAGQAAKTQAEFIEFLASRLEAQP